MKAVGLGSGILSKQSAVTVHLLTLPSQEPCSPHTRKDPGKSEVPRPPRHTRSGLQIRKVLYLSTARLTVTPDSDSGHLRVKI